MMNNIRVSVLAVILLSAQLRQSAGDAAFAYGQSLVGGWTAGTAYGHESESSAAAAAMRSCNQDGSNCKLQTTFKEGCFAFAVEDGDNGFAWAVRRSIQEAEAEALQKCHSMGNACTLQSSFCDLGIEICNRYPTLC